MLKNIRLHIEQDDLKQHEIEKKLAAKLTEFQRENVNVLQRNIPSLLQHINYSETQNIAVVCTKNSDINVVDYGQGRVLYGFEPIPEIQKQVDHFLKKPIKKDLVRDSIERDDSQFDDQSLTSLPAFHSYQNREPIPHKIELLVVLGLGLGHHLSMLLNAIEIKHLIIYEPEVQYFKCSVSATSWKNIFEAAKVNNTGIYIQIGKDARNLIDDINELKQHFDIEQFFLFQHYHHPVFDSVAEDLKSRSWPEILHSNLRIRLADRANDYCPKWTDSLSVEAFVDVDKNSQKYRKNLNAFRTYFPAIFEEFSNYLPKIWLPVLNETGEVNIIKKNNLVTWYGESPKGECIQNFDNFSSHPNKDGLVLGYQGEKLKHYLHYQFVKETSEILDNLEEEDGVLPDTIKSIIMFGLGVGYQLEHLVNSHNVEKLFICEPNRDFFYASLFAVDWEHILSTIDENEGRLYINIGDDGTNLFKDLLNQFYAIGPYVLSNTYFYQSYYNSALIAAISQLREQLQVVISMGEYFDHARFGIAHSKQALEHELPHMIKNAGDSLSYDDKEVPVFFIGNGPSLDYSLEVIQQNRDKAVIISCGTSLQVLYKNGIVPDFHAEIEQNRSTWDWANRLGDLSFLKNVTLISCNGIHPDTCDLYKDTLIAFKEGESSTTSMLEVLGEDNYETLTFAFPTVTNFALNFFIKLGYRQLYFFGVDLGFVDNSKHHSIQSGYYDKSGNALYDYAKKNNTSLRVPGNFRDSVFTKHEFKIAKMVMEQSLSSSRLEAYNTSDGAKIFGTKALDINNVLILSSAQDKQSSIQHMRANCFSTIDKTEFESAYLSCFSEQALNKELAMFEKRLENPVDTFEQAELLVESQKRMLFASYQEKRSLLFYFLYGTVNYANVVLNQVAYATTEGVYNQERFEHARKTWLKHFRKMKSVIENQRTDFDSSAALGLRRIIPCLGRAIVKKQILIVTDNVSFASLSREQAEWYEITDQVSILSLEKLKELPKENYRDCYLISSIKYTLDEEQSELIESFKELSKTSLTLINHSIGSVFLAENPNEKGCYLQALDGALSQNFPYECQDSINAQIALQCCLIPYLNNISFIIPKYTIHSTEQLDACIDLSDLREFHFYDFGWCIAATEYMIDYQNILPNGTRVAYLGYGLNTEYVVLQEIDEIEHESNLKNLLISFPVLSEDKQYV